MCNEFSPSPTATTLVVLFHGLGASARRLGGVRRAILESLPNADVFMPILWRGWTSNEHPVATSLRAIAMIDGIVAQHTYERIVFVGYSGGGIIARKVAIYVHGESGDAPFEADAKVLRGGRPWAALLDRIVLLAGMNRGWTFSPTSNVFVVWLMKLCYYAMRMARRGAFFAALHRGEPFVTDLRIQWLSLTRAGKDAITVVQLLGTIDDIVSPDDNIDLQTGRDFFYLDVAGSGHASVIEFQGPFGDARRAAFTTALVASRAALAEESLALLPNAEDSVDPTVEHVLFVIHGIRDYGFWTAHVARHVVAIAHRRGIRIVPLTPRYGYFAMLPFVLPMTRRAKIRWFMEQYTEALARFPNAERFSYIGHSNGTYLLAGALSRYTCCHFWNVVFAGSVVRADFPWSVVIPARVQRVLNYVADADWVVALFPRFLARLGADVGGAGWDGFTTSPPNPSHPVNDTEYVIGSHGTAIREQNWDDIAAFILADQLPRAAELARRHNRTVSALAGVSSLIWIALLVVILWPVMLFVPWPFTHLLGRMGGWSLGGRAFVTLVWFLLMRTILTRV